MYGVNPVQSGKGEKKDAKNAKADVAIGILTIAKSVIITPGYGLAVSRA